MNQPWWYLLCSEQKKGVQKVAIFKSCSFLVVCAFFKNVKINYANGHSENKWLKFAAFGANFVQCALWSSVGILFMCEYHSIIFRQIFCCCWPPHLNHNLIEDKYWKISPPYNNYLFSYRHFPDKEAGQTAKIERVETGKCFFAWSLMRWEAEKT